MDLRQLEYFLAVAEERSFTRGATRAHVVQSAASAAILRLEREIGQPLFVRRGRQLDLTEAGRLLLARARSIQELATQTREELDALRGGLSGTVTIGTILAFGSAALPGALKRFHARYPEVVVQPVAPVGWPDGVTPQPRHGRHVRPRVDSDAGTDPEGRVDAPGRAGAPRPRLLGRAPPG